MLTYSRSLKLSYLYGSAGGQIITKSNSRDTEKFQFDLYPSTGCKKTLTHDCFKCPVSNCYEDIDELFFANRTKKKKEK
jgi:hypothetical protein